MIKLTIELVPSSCWYSNVRSQVTPTEWDRLKRIASDAAGGRCEICKGRGPKWPVECHEVWDYNDKTLVQKLVRMTALCPACHEVKHIGLAGKRGRMQEATEHLMKVNEWDERTAQKYISKSFEIWARRSEEEWTLDISYLESLGMSGGRIDAERRYE